MKSITPNFFIGANPNLLNQRDQTKPAKLDLERTNSTQPNLEKPNQQKFEVKSNPS